MSIQGLSLLQSTTNMKSFDFGIKNKSSQFENDPLKVENPDMNLRLYTSLMLPKQNRLINGMVYINDADTLRK